MLGGQRVVLRAVVRGSAAIKVADPTGPRVLCKTLVTIRDTVTPEFQRRRFGGAHISLVRSRAVFAFEASSAAAAGPAARGLVGRWWRRDEVKTSCSSIYHGI